MSAKSERYYSTPRIAGPASRRLSARVCAVPSPHACSAAPAAPASEGSPPRRAPSRAGWLRRPSHWRPPCCARESPLRPRSPAWYASANAPVRLAHLCRRPVAARLDANPGSNAPARAARQSARRHAGRSPSGPGPGPPRAAAGPGTPCGACARARALPPMSAAARPRHMRTRFVMCRTSRTKPPTRPRRGRFGLNRRRRS